MANQMNTYNAPLSDYAFLLEHVLRYNDVISALPGYEDASLDLALAVIQESARFAEEKLAPLNQTGDEEACIWKEGAVTTPTGFKEAYNLFRQGGWPGLVASPEHGGQGLPRLIGLIQREIISATNTSFGTYTGLSQSAYHALAAYGSSEIKERILPHIVDGRWTGTMCLTEPHSGSDLALLNTKAAISSDGTYQISGTKIFVTGGEHDLAENIVHMVLARLPDAPQGIKGLSLFMVPKFIEAEDGSWTRRNALTCTGIEHKMGIRASATASLSFDEAAGWLIGKPHQGIQAMFVMMNSSRLGVSVQAVGLAEGALQKAKIYAVERVQGRSASAHGTNAPVAIINHADVRRNLLIAKAFIEGARALWMWAGMMLDRVHKHPDPLIVAECDQLLALLTPVFKAFFSDKSFQATNSAMQVFGGHGYIRETGIEQYVRDGRIIPLYEGTNGIQALDLVSRKISLNNGSTINYFFELVQNEINIMRDIQAPSSGVLESALNNLRVATDFICQNKDADPHLNGAIGHDYLQLFGLTAMGFAWAKIMNAASGIQDGSSKPYAESKLKVAAFFFAHVLPEHTSHFESLLGGSKALMFLENSEF